MTTAELHHYQQWATANSELLLGTTKLSAAVVLVQSNDSQTTAYLYSQFGQHLFQSSMQTNNMTFYSFIHRGGEWQLVASKWPLLYLCLAQRCASSYHCHTGEVGPEPSSVCGWLCPDSAGEAALYTGNPCGKMDILESITSERD